MTVIINHFSCRWCPTGNTANNASTKYRPKTYGISKYVDSVTLGEGDSFKASNKANLKALKKIIASWLYVTPNLFVIGLDGDHSFHPCYRES
jgi:hypothetical protein